MIEFTYKNAKNISTDHILFELNCGFCPQVLFKEDINSDFRSYLANKLVDKLRELMEICF